ncbi:SPT3 Dosage dependent suppressor of Ty-induced promoter mutations-like protein [Podochytrium sp. JEL0797]|nr:SPT3 Dosage dependent suppressor of Ty-induced promoter mutations-like protein [Podochytrium sp. JEL0797]
MIHSILEQFRGTHDWHNYAPATSGGTPDGGNLPVFLRISDVSCSKPTLEYGMEWIRVSLSCPLPLPRTQLRCMMAMLILVVRTNTPRSIIAASFGGQQKCPGIPLAPVRGSGILGVGYSRWNDGVVAGGGRIDFGEKGMKEYVEGFVDGTVRDEVYIEEEDGMEFEGWLKEMTTNYFRMTSPATSDGDSIGDSAYASLYSDSDSKSPLWQPRLGVLPAVAEGGVSSSAGLAGSGVGGLAGSGFAGSGLGGSHALALQRTLSLGGNNSSPSNDGFSLDALKAQMDAAFGFAGGFQIKVLGVPLTNARSRVETQTKLCLQMLNHVGNKTSAWSHLRLPEQLVTKEKLRKSQNVIDYSLIPINKVLDLQAIIVCASDPKKDVQICSGCQLRESKRSKKKSDAPPPSSSAEPVKVEDLGLFNGGLDLAATMASTPDNDSGKIVLFNCGSYVDFSSGDTILPTRITCYCRHHNEKTGFCVYFIARDHNSTVIATGISPPILITDDHKGTKTKGQKRSRADELADLIPEMISPTSPPSTVVRPQTSDFQDDIIAQFIPALLASEFNAPLFENFGIKKNNSLTDDATRASKKQFQSPITSTQPTLFPSTPSVPTALINRIIPGEGPIQGGVEITILGEHMHNGLIAVFGDLEAITTQVWGSTTLICILPPSSTPGPVPVTLKAIAGFAGGPSSPVSDATAPVTFMYKDDLDRSLMELALQVVGLRMTGSLDSARNVCYLLCARVRVCLCIYIDEFPSSLDAQIAMRIVNQTAQETMNDSSLSFDELKRNQLETAILNALFSMEEQETTDDLSSSPHHQVVLTSLLDMTFHPSHGLNMLHIAALAGMTTLVKYLVSLDCDVDPRDRNGFTPLMFCVQSGQWECARILVRAGASWLLTSRGGVGCVALARRKRGERGVMEFVGVVEEGVRGWEREREEEEWEEEEEEEGVVEGGGGVVANMRRRVSCPTSFSVPAVPGFVAVEDAKVDSVGDALPEKESVSVVSEKSIKHLTDAVLDSKSPVSRSGAKKLHAPSARWTNPEDELTTIMNGFKMFSFLGPLVHTMASPLVVNRVDMGYLFSEEAMGAVAAAVGFGGDEKEKDDHLEGEGDEGDENVTSRIPKASGSGSNQSGPRNSYLRKNKKLQRKLDQTVSGIPFSGFEDTQDHCCESWNNGIGTHQVSCRQAVLMRKLERRRRRNRHAVWLFWLPLLTLCVVVMMGYFVLSEDERGALFERFLTWNDGLVGKVRDTYKAVRKDSKHLVFEFLNTGFGQL